MSLTAKNLSTDLFSGLFIGGRGNYGISHTLDYEDGGIAVGNTSAGHMFQIWRGRLISPNIIIDAPFVEPFILYTDPDITEFSFTFDQNMNIIFSFVSNGTSYIRYMSDGNYINKELPAGSTNPRVFLDDKRETQLRVGASDIILAYIRNGNLCVSIQRENYNTEHIVASDITTELLKIGINQYNRIQYAMRLDDSEILSPPYQVTMHGLNHLVEWLVLERTTVHPTEFCPESFDSDAYPDKYDIKLGKYIDDDSDVSEAVESMCSSVGMHARFGSGSCKFQLVKFKNPEEENPVLVLTEEDIIEKGVSLVSIEKPETVVAIGYRKNYTELSKEAIAGRVIENDDASELEALTSPYKELRKENVQIVIKNSITEALNSFPVKNDPEIMEIDIWGDLDAQGEIDRRANLRKKKHFIYKLECVSTPFGISVGDVINITYSRYIFKNSVNALVIGVTEQPTQKKVTLEVWV